MQAADASAISSAPERVGRGPCIDCHAEQGRLWAGSHHDLAMDVANESTVLGDFDDAEFTYAGVTSRFYRRDGHFFVRTDGADGTLSEHEITYTYGFQPLQQYLVEFPDGRIQALSICWDTRPPEQGGQRWFHLYPGEEVDHEDELHWTGPLQNWNFMCSECHSTGVRKGYDADLDRFDTTWEEIDVSCEACHGPGSRHVAWAKQESRDPNESKRLLVELADTDGGHWIPDAETGLASRSVPRTSFAEIETCARCHSRRSAFSDIYRHGRPLMETHRVTLLEEYLYHADGQIQDEVYVYGSFVQSKMHTQGVTCSDCHDPHSLELLGPVDVVCASCHAGDRFQTPSHHFHEQGSPGSACSDCHMPMREYMVVDPRHDHSFRVPRPDVSMRIGTPNACNDCHDDRTPEWAASTVAAWYGSDREPHYGEALHAGRRNLPGAAEMLRRVARNSELPGIVSATAASLLEGYPSPETATALGQALRSDDPLRRFGALQAAESLPPAPRVALVFPLLADPVRTVRMEAAQVLAPIAPGQLPEEHRARLEMALDEYRGAQLFNTDRADAHLNLGLLHQHLGELADAEQEYRLALERDRSFVPAYVNLSDLYRQLGRDTDGEKILREALAIAPEHPAVEHALGLLLVRQKRTQAAISFLERAARLRPDEARYSYVYGVALHSVDNSAGALTVLEQAHRNHPGDRDILLALASVSRDTGALQDAIGYARQLLNLAPEDLSVRQFIAQLESALAAEGG